MGKTAKRGKKDDAGELGTTETLESELERAETAIRNNQFQVNAIHKQWKTYLQRLSYMVLLIAFHQMQSPSTACLKDVKSFNLVAPEPITGKEVILLVLSDSMVHLLAIVMAASLSFFLLHQQESSASPAKQQEKQQQKQMLFSNPRYMLSNACIPPLLALYFGSQKAGKYSSCLDMDLLEQAQVEPVERQRSLPVVLIFHVIVTFCLWFMDMQQDQILTNIQKVDTLRRELLQAREQDKSKKKQ